MRLHALERTRLVHKQVLVLLFSLSGIALSAQGPVTGFMPGRKNTDMALSYSTESYDTYFFGKEKQDISVASQSVSLFLERGLSDSFSLVLTVPYIWIDEENQGFQDGQVFIKYRNQRSAHKAGSLSLITAIGLSFPVSGYEKESDTPIGERATVFQGRLLMQYDFKIGFFLHLQSGVNFRIIPDAQSSMPILFRTGFGASRFYVDGWVEILNTFNAGVDTQVFGGAGSNWTKIGGTLYYAILPQLGLFIGGSSVLSGINIGQSGRLNLGVVGKLR